MQEAWIYALISVLIVSLISFIGVLTLGFREAKLRKMLSLFISFSAGALLGDVFIHLLPEIAEEVGFELEISLTILFGILTTFIIEKVIHWQHNQMDEANQKPHPVTTLTLFGDGVHNFVDGLIIGGSFLVNPTIGMATTLAVILHEIPQELGNFGVLVHGGYSVKKALLFNFLSALTAVLGTIVALTFGGGEGEFGLYITAFTSGVFIYIAGSDLIPELNKETSASRSIHQFIWLLLGIAIMFALLGLE